MHQSNTHSEQPERRAGVCLHIASLPGPYGIGEIGEEAHRFIDSMCRMKLSVWQFLPIGPTAFGNSPYLPLSAFAGNEMLIDLGNFIDLGLLHEAEVSELSELSTQYVDYGAIIPLKTRLLKIAASRFASNASAELQDAFVVFVTQNDSTWLHDYALYRVLKTQHDERPWIDWHPDYVHRNEKALSDLERGAKDPIDAIKIIQFLFFWQWSKLKDYANAKGVKLFGDLPIYIALDSADAWASPEILRIDRDGRADCVAGVPPDYFSEGGQLWGNPLYDWAKHAADGYEWWVQRLRATSELFDLVRIDHFRGFESFWSVPADHETARDGAWEPGPGDAIFNAMREALGDLPIVAEDLGVITPEVDRLRARQRFPGMRVLQFDIRDSRFDLDQIEEDRVCYTGTHDNDTTVGWYYGGAHDTRDDDEILRTQEAALRITGGTARTIHTDLIKAAFSTKARLAIAPMQDYLGLGPETRTNVPGTSDGNWRWRVLHEQLDPEFCDNVALLVTGAARGEEHG